MVRRDALAGLRAKRVAFRARRGIVDVAFELVGDMECLFLGGASLHLEKSVAS